MMFLPGGTATATATQEARGVLLAAGIRIRHAAYSIQEEKEDEGEGGSVHVGIMVSV